MPTALAQSIPIEIEKSREDWLATEDALADLRAWLMAEETLDKPIHHVEHEVCERGREIMRRALQAHLNERGRGDVGRAILVLEESKNNIVLLSHRRDADRGLHTTFGTVSVQRLAYAYPGEESLSPVDNVLQLPSRQHSYEVQRHLVRESVKGPYGEAVKTVEEFTGVRVSKRTCEDVVNDAAVDFKSFYKHRTLPPPCETREILVGSVDCKGIPMKQAKPEHQIAGAPVERRSGVKKMATVAAAYTVAPRVRTPEEVTASLFNDPQKLRPVPTVGEAANGPQQEARPENKRLWASLDDGKDVVVEQLAEELEQRDPEHTKTRVALLDGESALQRRVVKLLPTFLLILDLLHVLDKLWKAAGILVEEGKKHKKDREAWVRVRVLSILKGKVSEVVRGIRQSLTKRKLKGKNAKKLKNICNYLYANRNHTRYHEYLAAGLPIASGVIEGACKNLVKARMEGPGMRWCTTTEAMLQMRALYLSGDFEDYWVYHIQAEQERLHGRRTWKVADQLVS